MKRLVIQASGAHLACTAVGLFIVAAICWSTTYVLLAAVVAAMAAVIGVAGAMMLDRPQRFAELGVFGLREKTIHVVLCSGLFITGLLIREIADHTPPIMLVVAATMAIATAAFILMMRRPTLSERRFAQVQLGKR